MQNDSLLVLDTCEIREGAGGRHGRLTIMMFRTACDTNPLTSFLWQNEIILRRPGKMNLKFLSMFHAPLYSHLKEMCYNNLLLLLYLIFVNSKRSMEDL